MKMFIHLKKNILPFYLNITNNKIFIRLIRKPFNTFFLSNLSYRKKAYKDSKIWRDQSIYKIEQYEEITSEFFNKFNYYLLSETNKEDKILDICCNQGRFLKFLHHKGYRSLLGVDIMSDAIMKLKRSEEYKMGGIYAEENLAQEFILTMEENSIDYAITYSATIELLHPGFNIFKELKRITRKGFIFVLSEDGYTYPRFYRYQIKANEFNLKYVEKFANNLTLIHAEN